MPVSGRQIEIRSLLPLLACAVLASAPACGQLQHADNVRAIEKRILANVEHMRAATVAVRVGSQNASGVIVEGGFVMTTGHAVQRIGQPATVRIMDATSRSATVHSIDRTNDIALLKLEKTGGLVVAQLGRLNAGDSQTVVAVGNPGGYQEHRESLLRFGTAIGGSIIRSTCRIAQGDSGGPLFDLNGHVVGIHRQILKGAQNNFHTSASAVSRNWKRLVAGGMIAGSTARVSKTEWVPPASRVVQPNHACVEILCDDRRVALGTVVDAQRGWVISKLSELAGQTLHVRLASQTVPAEILHTDKALDLAILQAAGKWVTQINLQKASASSIGSIVLSILPDGTSRQAIVGAPARRIQSQSGELGLAADDQLVITNVQPNSAAKKADLRKGDRIDSSDGTQLSKPADLGKLLGELNAGDWFGLKVRRDAKAMNVRVRLLHPASQRFDNATFQMGAAGASSERRSGFAAVWQHDASIQPQDCGGPVVNLSGDFVGINIARAGREAVYMVPADQINALLEHIRRK